MEIYTKDFFNIFKANFDFEIVETEMGLAVKMPAKEAFIYSSITGAGYFENPIYPFTPKGLMKLFYNALTTNSYRAFLIMESSKTRRTSCHRQRSIYLRVINISFQLSLNRKRNCSSYSRQSSIT